MIRTQNEAAHKKTLCWHQEEMWTPSQEHSLPAGPVAALESYGPTVLSSFGTLEGIFKTFPLILFFFNDRAVILGVSISEFQRLWLEWKWVAVIWPFKSSYTVSHFCKPCELLSAEGQGLTPSSVRNISEDPLQPTRQHMCQSPVGESFESVDESVCPNLGPGEGMGGAGVGWTWPS